jgi:alkylation response protein AidB-like acyl-CoA dehydrogenase
MVLCMHYCGVAVLEPHAPEDVRRRAATGEHLSTLAFSEAGSRSQFWAPVSTATRDGDEIVLDARKSWITSAGHGTAYVWSSRPVQAEGASTLWLVPAGSPGLRVLGPFDGLGLRGNDSSPVHAEGLRVSASAMLGSDGAGLGIMLGTVLPLFQLLNASCSLGLMQAAVQRTLAHVTGTGFEQSGSSLRDLPTIRAYVARMSIETDMVQTLLDDTAAAIEAGRADAMLRVLQSKAAAGESATRVLDTAMRVCGGAAFRREVGVERLFRDGRAAGVMAPTTDVLYDFIGKALTGLDLL